MANERVIVFGLGGKLLHEKKNKKELYESLNIVNFCDNNTALTGTEYDGKKVIAPADLNQCQFDRIIVASNYYREIACQLADMGIDRAKIIHWNEYAVRDMHGQVTIYDPDCRAEGKSVLLISTTLGINGGTVAIINAAEALSRRGYAVSLCAQGANMDIVPQITSKGIQVILCPAICYPDENELTWIGKYDYIIVNVYQMMRCASYISRSRKVMWWIHECSEKYSSIYLRIQSLFFEYCMEQYENISVYAVSNIAKKNFQKHHPRQDVDIITLGVAEQSAVESEKEQRKKKHVFAVIGAVEPRKGQMDVLRTVDAMNRERLDVQYEFWIIGKAGNQAYAREVEEKAALYPNVKLWGEVNVDRMHMLYMQIDTVICFSYEETMSLVVIEGMMNNKTCIATDNTGIAEYIEDYKNGFICSSGDAGELAGICKWILTHEKECKSIAGNARKTYEECFTLDRLGQRVEAELLKL